MAHFKAHNEISHEPDLSANEKVKQWTNVNQDYLGPGLKEGSFEEHRITTLENAQQSLQDHQLMGLAQSTMEQNRETHAPSEVFNGLDDQIDPDVNDVDANDEDLLSNLPFYRDYVIKSPAYRLLTLRIQRDIQMSMATSDVMRSISEQLLIYLLRRSDARVLSRHQPPHICTVEFSISWLPLEFLQDEEYLGIPEEVLGKVITITGTGTSAQALTVEQYLQRTWPLTGIKVLEALEDSIRHHNGDKRRHESGKPPS